MDSWGDVAVRGVLLWGGVFAAAFGFIFIHTAVSDLWALATSTDETRLARIREDWRAQRQAAGAIIVALFQFAAWIIGIWIAVLLIGEFITQPIYEKRQAAAAEKRLEIAKVEVAREGFEEGRNSYCTDDCSGHIAGFEWAAARHETSLWACPIERGDSFHEGCLDYVSEVLERARDA